jgi:uncharacterized protein
MKRFCFWFILVSLSTLSFGQTAISGSWAGTLALPTGKLRLVFNIQADASGKLSATMDSPDQGAKGLPVDKVTFNKNLLECSLNALGVKYSGTFVADSMLVKGEFSQAGYNFPLNLYKDIKKEIVRKKQEPVRPFPYSETDVSFENKIDKIKLAGTLTMPANASNCAAVILVTGSGPQNRDEELLGHKPFLVLSDYLTRRGIAVFRYDDRGVGKSEGKFASATTADFASDAASAIDFLKTQKGINPAKIGIAGHSEGGIVSAIIAATRKDLAFGIMLAGPGLKGSDLLLLQIEAISKAAGLPDDKIVKNLKTQQSIFDLIRKNTDNENAIQAIVKQVKSDKAGEFSMQDSAKLVQETKAMVSPWYRYFLDLNPADYLTKITCPLLVLNGEKDLQVPYAANFKAIKQALPKKNQTSFVSFPGLNHLFQSCNTGLPSEYASNEETMNEEVMKTIAEWIKLRIIKNEKF